ncbi:MAG TPA: PaaI family thioesterase [Bacteroidales bacterium]|nr:PaaI family thioesterase [Bacteroidales bacterium]
MKKIKNPYIGYKEHYCFGCSPRNPIGLKLDFYEDKEWVVSTWKPGSEYEGWHDILHGGIQSTLLDELGSWVAYSKKGGVAVTSKLEIRFIKPVYISDGEITLKGRIKDIRRNILVIEAFLYDGKNEIGAECLMYYFVLSPAQTAKLMPSSEINQLINDGSEGLE